MGGSRNSDAAFPSANGPTNRAGDTPARFSPDPMTITTQRIPGQPVDQPTAVRSAPARRTASSSAPRRARAPAPCAAPSASKARPVSSKKRRAAGFASIRKASGARVWRDGVVSAGSGRARDLREAIFAWPVGSDLMTEIVRATVRLVLGAVPTGPRSTSTTISSCACSTIGALGVRGPQRDRPPHSTLYTDVLIEGSAGAPAAKARDALPFRRAGRRLRTGRLRRSRSRRCGRSRCGRRSRAGSRLGGPRGGSARARSARRGRGFRACRRARP